MAWELTEQFKTLHKQGLSTREIAKQLNISESVGYNYIRKLGLKSNGTPLKQHTKEDIEFIKKEYLQGKTIQQIATENPQYKEGWINFRLRKLNITRPNGKQAIINHNYFQTIDSAEKAYWLGLLSADGYVSQKENNIRMSLKISDKYLVQQLTDCLESSLQVKEYQNSIPRTVNNKTYYSGKHEAYNNFTSKQLVHDILQHHCTKQYGKQQCFPLISDELLKWFILGYYDGDGIAAYSISKNNSLTKYMGFCGQKLILQQINEFLHKDTQGALKLHNLNYNRSNHIYYLTYSSNEEMSILYEYFYNNNHPYYLHRKKDKIHQYFVDYNVQSYDNTEVTL